MTNHAPVIPYAVSALTHNRQNKVLISSQERLNQIHGTISRPWGVTEVEFFLWRSDDTPSLKFIYFNHLEDFIPVIYEQIESFYSADKIPQEETDSIANGEIKFFVFAGENHWGFHVVPVARRDEQLFIGNKEFFAFETDLSELDFFDGQK